jgi:hypothetical protein
MDLVLGDYGTTVNEISQRDNVTLVGGTILIAASFLILAEIIRQNPGYPVFLYEKNYLKCVLNCFFKQHYLAKTSNFLKSKLVFTQAHLGSNPIVPAFG